MMSHGERSQFKLHFEQCRPAQHQGSHLEVENLPDKDTGAEPPNGTAAKMDDLRAKICCIDIHLDSFADRIDHLGERLDSQTSRLDSAEERISGLGDDAENTVKWLEKLECNLKTVAIKSEDLEARSCRSNICILGIAESMHMGHLDSFVEQPLITLFGCDSFTTTFLVEHAADLLEVPIHDQSLFVFNY
ncbi:hypothetical protein NDU88_002970 [Pleurodeles waltl]|uniref:Uncharacterized protein n=1 Tax=Pleurodeles waltl TaxID=8319 RepID=A0AAV7MS35_PLEWA|nr:hypothetical protein NDU88_002970 [Pleurodeles waltl]